MCGVSCALSSWAHCFQIPEKHGEWFVDTNLWITVLRGPKCWIHRGKENRDGNYMYRIFWRIAVGSEKLKLPPTSYKCWENWRKGYRLQRPYFQATFFTSRMHVSGRDCGPLWGKDQNHKKPCLESPKLCSWHEKNHDFRAPIRSVTWKNINGKIFIRDSKSGVLRF